MQYQTQGYIISEGEDIACALEDLSIQALYSSGRCMVRVRFDRI
jgi:hypothetical protein